jgi:acyl-CoA dehydrogenase
MSKATVNIPFSEPPWLNGLPSPYYSESHRRWQKACREFLDKHLIANAFEWDQDELVPEQVFSTFAKHNMLIPSLPAPLPVEWLKKLGITELIGGVKVEEFDYIHMMIYSDEVSLQTNIDTISDGHR